MKTILLLHLVTFGFAVKTLSQKIDDTVPKHDSYFLAVKTGLNTDASPTSNTFCVGDEIKVKLMDNKIVSGKISELSQNYITTAYGNKIDVNKIKWIKTTKLTASRAIVGGLVTTAGVALFIPVAKGNVDFGQIVPLGGLGIGLITGGLLILTSRTKFNIEKGDRLIFTNQN